MKNRMLMEVILVEAFVFMNERKRQMSSVQKRYDYYAAAFRDYLKNGDDLNFSYILQTGEEAPHIRSVDQYDRESISLVASLLTDLVRREEKGFEKAPSKWALISLKSLADKGYPKAEMEYAYLMKEQKNSKEAEEYMKRYFQNPFEKKEEKNHMAEWVLQEFGHDFGWRERSKFNLKECVQTNADCFSLYQEGKETQGLPDRIMRMAQVLDNVSSATPEEREVATHFSRHLWILAMQEKQKVDDQTAHIAAEALGILADKKYPLAQLRYAAFLKLKGEDQTAQFYLDQAVRNPVSFDHKERYLSELKKMGLRPTQEPSQQKVGLGAVLRGLTHHVRTLLNGSEEQKTKDFQKQKELLKRQSHRR